MTALPVRYRSPDEDSGRWIGFPFREGDIVISTRSKHGTTWMQMICALLVYQDPELSAPLSAISPWLDWLVQPREAVVTTLQAQRHRRVIKTHTPLDGVPIDERARYIVVARHPLDAAVSLYHQGNNIDRERLRELTGAPARDGPRRAAPDLHAWLLDYIEHPGDARTELDGLAGVMHHLSDAWARRSASNVLLVHYDDLSTDLEGEMRWLADRLGIRVPGPHWPGLIQAASFADMRRRADLLAPDASGLLRDRTAFFRRGMPGAGAEVLTPGELDRYHARAATLAPPDLLAWLHRDHRSTS